MGSLRTLQRGRAKTIGERTTLKLGGDGEIGPVKYLGEPMSEWKASLWVAKTTQKERCGFRKERMYGFG